MKKFDFRLQTVLKLRKQQEDQKKRKVGSLLAEINELQQQALNLARDVQQQGQTLKQHIRGAVDVSWVAYYHGYVTYLHHAIAERIKAVGEVQQQLVQARQELTEAARQTKILEKLKEKQKQRFDRRIQKMEAREIDEIGQNQFFRAANSA